jgi:hypothetical protein
MGEEILAKVNTTNSEFASSPSLTFNKYMTMQVGYYYSIPSSC